jgi:hypothetical protein
MEILYLPSANGTGQSHALSVAVNNEPAQRNSFIEANTIQGTLSEIRQNHIIPVFTKDNEPVISQVDFIEITQEVVGEVFASERVLSPSIRLSHEIKGRIPEARNKPASELQEWERTIYYDRMAFILEVSSISDIVGGEKVSLSIGGVKAYNLDNLHNRKGADEHFKVFIGFKVSVCTNLCVWTDGFISDLRVKNLRQLRDGIYGLVHSFDAISQLRKLKALNNYGLTEKQFAQLIGRCRMYQYLPGPKKTTVPELQFGDSQINSVCRDYYKDGSFCRDEDGNINLWRLYNLFTAANKQSYIDTFLDRSVNASCFVEELAYALEHKSLNWFLS